jgi:hypothetical protein
VRPYLEKPFTKIGLVEWLKVKTLSSRPTTTKKTKTKKHFKTSTVVHVCNPSYSGGLKSESCPRQK